MPQIEQQYKLKDKDQHEASGRLVFYPFLIIFNKNNY